jgi:hypothetical protein
LARRRSRPDRCTRRNGRSSRTPAARAGRRRVARIVSSSSWTLNASWKFHPATRPQRNTPQRSLPRFLALDGLLPERDRLRCCGDKRVSIDDGTRLRDPATWPIHDEIKITRRRQRPQPVRVGRAEVSATTSVKLKHRPDRRRGVRTEMPALIRCNRLSAVRELDAKPRTRIGQGKRLPYSARGPLRYRVDLLQPVRGPSGCVNVELEAGRNATKLIRAIARSLDR